jgi:FAD/FMN-containing dehydrogenase
MRKEIAVPRYFKAKTFYLKEAMTEAQLATMGNALETIPNNNIWLLINTEQGVIWNVPAAWTSYVHRRAYVDFSVHYEGSDAPEDVREGMTWLNDFVFKIKSIDSGYSYQNYPDLDIPAPERLQRYYGSNLAKLKAAKRKWDPKNYFQSPLSLPLR